MSKSEFKDKIAFSTLGILTIKIATDLIWLVFILLKFSYSILLREQSWAGLGRERVENDQTKHKINFFTFRMNGPLNFFYPVTDFFVK